MCKSLGTEEEHKPPLIGTEKKVDFRFGLRSDCVMQNKPIRTPGELGLRDIRIILAVIESARLGGKPVKVGRTIG